MSFYIWQENILILEVYVQPRAKTTEVAGLFNNRLRIRIKSAPVDNKANQSVIKFLAGEFKVPASSIKLLSGHRNRNKRIQIQGPASQPEWLTTI